MRKESHLAKFTQLESDRNKTKGRDKLSSL